MAKLRIFLADDHAVVLPDMEVVGAAACEQVPQLRVDVVVLNVSMPWDDRRPGSRVDV
jgi:hypothetical protein